MGKFKKGHKTNVGKSRSIETRAKISKSNIGKNLGKRKGFPRETEEKIVDLYNIKKRSLRTICKELKIHRISLKKFLKANGIKIRTSLEQRKVLKIPSWRKIEFSEDETKDILKMYDRGKSALEIGKKYNCCYVVILNLLHKNNIKINSTAFYHKIRGFESPHKIKISEMEGKKIMEMWNNGMSIIDINRKMDIFTGAIRRELDKNGITKEEIRKRKNSTNKKYGENHPNWKGGISFEPYGLDFNIKLKNSIRKRDNQCCMICGLHREKYYRAFDIHHVNYDKTCNIEQNLISLCHRCHMTTNYNRKYWQKFLQDLLNDRYCYKYSEVGEIILEF